MHYFIFGKLSTIITKHSRLSCPRPSSVIRPATHAMLAQVIPDDVLLDRWHIPRVVLLIGSAGPYATNGELNNHEGHASKLSIIVKDMTMSE